MPELHDYLVTIYDPEQNQRVTFKEGARRIEAAISAAKHGYTGLLGGPELERKREQLEVLSAVRTDA